MVSMAEAILLLWNRSFGKVCFTGTFLKLSGVFMKNCVIILVMIVLLSQLALASKPVTCPLLYNTDLPGSDYKSVNLTVAEPTECQKLCEGDPSCSACTYVKPGVQGPYAKCWLKNQVPNEVPDSNCVSWSKYCIIDVGPENNLSVAKKLDDFTLFDMYSPKIRNLSKDNLRFFNNTTEFWDNMDLPGSDYTSFNLTADNPSLCSQACKNDTKCAACTYVKPGFQGPSARCWLKYEVPPVTTGNCCSSWIKTE